MAGFFLLLVARPASRPTGRTTFKDNQIGGRSLWYSDHTEGGAASTVRAATVHFVDLVLGGVNSTRQAIAFTTIADNLHPPSRHLVAEWRRRLQIDRIPTELDKRLAIRVSVGTGDVRTPISPRVRRRSPYTGFLG